MATQKRQASVLGSTLTSLTLNSDLSSTEEETSEADDDDFENTQRAKGSGDSGEGTDHDTEKGKQGQDKDGVKKSEKPPKPRVRMKTLTIDGQLVYFCVLCDKIFTRKKDKLNHELAHSSETVLTCTECGKEYFHESSLAYHMRSHDADQLHLCDLCPKMFAQGHHLKSHILTHSQPTEFSCKTCYQDFALASDLSEHIRNKIKEEMVKYWCKICKLYFCRNHNDFKNVKKLHAHQCTACNELFYSHKKLRLHMKKFAHKSVDKPRGLEPLAAEEMYSLRGIVAAKKEGSCSSKFTCSSSNRDVTAATSSKRRLGSHEDNNNKPFSKRRRLPSKCFVSEAIHSSSSFQDSAPEVKPVKDFILKSPVKGRKGKPYCKKCNKSFKDISELDSHKLLAHGEAPKHFACDICHQRFLSQTECENHKAQHRKEEMHTCPICSQDFFHSIELTQHLKEHSGDFPYKCNQCGKSFRLKLQLIQHIRLHIPQTPLACDKCGLQLSNKKDFDEHMVQAHDEENEFKCHLCNKVFQFRYKLQNHLRLHTNVKTFQCYICHKSFAMKQYLQRHLQIHLRQGIDVDMTNIIKTETDDGNNVTDVSCEGAEINCDQDGVDKIDVQHIVNSTQHQGFKEHVNRRIRPTYSTLKLDFQKVQDDVSSDSEESACSVLTRESEKSDPFRFSSDGSDSFKFTMAKERRKLRKKRQLSRLALYNKLNALKSEQLNERQVEYAQNHSVIDQDDSDTIQDMMVEINGVKSHANNEISIFVNLKDIEPPSDFGQSSTHNIDLTDKENRLPSYESLSHALDFINRARKRNDDFHDMKDSMLPPNLEGQTLVLDFEIDDGSMNIIFSPKELLNTDHLSTSDIDATAMKKGLSPDGNKLQSDVTCNKLSSEAKSHVQTNPVCNFSEKPASALENPTGMDKPSESVFNSSLDAQDILPIQPLQSLHFMTAQIENGKKGNEKGSTKIDNNPKPDKKKVKSHPNATSDKPRNKVTKQKSSSHVSSVSHHLHDSRSKQSCSQHQKDININAESLSESESKNSKTCFKHGFANQTGKQSDASNLIHSSNSQTQAFNSLSIPSAISRSPHLSYHPRSSQENVQTSETIGLPLSGNFLINSTSSSMVSEQSMPVQSCSLPSSSSLPRHNEFSQANYNANRNCDAIPKEYPQPIAIANSPSKSRQSSINISSSSHIVPARSSSVSSLYSDSKFPSPISISDHNSVFKHPFSSSIAPTTISNPLNSGQIFDTKNPVLRDVNMMDLIASNQGGIPSAPMPVLTGLSPIASTSQENQNVYNLSTAFRPLSSSTPLPPQPAPLTSNVFLDSALAPLPNKPNNILISDVPGPNMPAINQNLPVFNNFTNVHIPPSFGQHIGPPMPFNLDLGLASAPAPSFSSLDNFGSACNMNTLNLGMAGSNLHMPVGNLGVGGLDSMSMPFANVTPNPLSLLNVDVMGNPLPTTFLRPTMNSFNNPVNLLSYGGTGTGMINGGLNPLPNGISSFDAGINSNLGTIVPPGLNPAGMPLVPPGMMSNLHVPLGPVNFPLGNSFVPESGILPPHPFGNMNTMNSGPFLPM